MPRKTVLPDAVTVSDGGASMRPRPDAAENRDLIYTFPFEPDELQ